MAELIYHYTSLEAFLSILQTRKFWATNIYYTSDYGEIHHGILRCNFLIKNSIKPEDQDAQYLEFEKLISPVILPNKEIYFLSFSKHRNDLSQWRAYAKNGVCLGINPDLFSEIPPSSCIYEEDEKIEQIINIISKNYLNFINSPDKFSFEDVQKKFSVKKEIIETFLPIVTANLPFHCEKYGLELVANLYFTIQLHLWGFFPLAKSSSFKVENEVRYLYSLDDNKIRYKITNNLLTPYIEVDFDLNSISEIWVDTKQVEFDLMQYSISNLWSETTKSSIPLPEIIPARLSLR